MVAGRSENEINPDDPDGGWEEYKKSMEAKGFDPISSASVEAFDKVMEGIRQEREDEIAERVIQTEGVTNIFYTRGDNSTRHYVLDGQMTLCGLTPFRAEILALPVNCKECRILLGKVNREH